MRCVLGVGRPHFLAIDQPAVPVPDGPCRNTRRVGAGIGLSDAKVHHDFSLGHLRKVFVLQRLRSVSDNGSGREDIEMDGRRATNTGSGRRDLAQEQEPPP